MGKHSKKYAFIGVGLSALLFVFSILIIALYGASTDMDNRSCDTLKIRDRTAGVGIFAGISLFFYSIIALAIYALPFSGRLSERSTQKTISRVVILAGGLFVGLFLLVGWALLAKDIDDVNDDTICDPPGTWGAAFAFALLAWIGVAFMKILAVVEFIADRRSTYEAA